MKVNIAIIGLGVIGGAFLRSILKQKERGIHVAAVAEIGYTPGLIHAKESGVPIMKAEEIVSLGENVDIIFDATNNTDLRRQIRSLLKESGNTHTTLIPEVISDFIWSVLEEKPMPNIHQHKGYNT